MSFSEITKNIAKSLGKLFSSQEIKHKKNILEPRRLHMDSLEERQLLSVSVSLGAPTVSPVEKTLTSFSPNTSPSISSSTFYINGNNSYGGNKYTESIWGNDYIASNNQGDTVIVWTQNDYVYKMDKNGNYLVDSVTGEKIRATDRFGNFYDDYNVYAQYLTDQVERLTLPKELLDNSIADSDGRFKLVYAPYEIQRLSIKTVTTASGGMMGTGSNVVMQFQLGGVDTDQDGVPNYSDSIYYDENLSPAKNAYNIQTALQHMGGIYANVEVTAESSKDFLITYKGDQCAGVNVPELLIKDSQVTTGIYAGAIMSTVSEPIVISAEDSWGSETGIRVDPTNPQTTAMRIQQAFNKMTEYSAFPRVENYTRVKTEDVNLDYRPSYDEFYTAEVSVAWVDGTTFDITFINSSGLCMQDIMIVSATDEYGTEYVGTAAGKPKAEFTTTIKQSSEAFRVNAPEENDPTSSIPLVKNQLNPAVAMDADGDFVITWQSEAGTMSNTSITDIYARRFSPQAIVSEDKISFYSDGYTTKRAYGGTENVAIQGVRPVGDQFKVNTHSNLNQTSPSIGMDPDGNFIIAWSASIQSHTDGNDVYARRYDRYGAALSDAVLLSTTDSPLIHTNVAISNDGYAVVSWSDSEDTNFENYSVTGPLYMSVFAPGSMTPMAGWDQYSVASTSYNPSVSFDAHNNFVITYTDEHPRYAKGTNAAESSDVRAQMFNFSATDKTFTQAKGEFLVHSLSNWLNNHYADESWRGAQYNGIGRLDADGDMVFIYQGYGPDSNLSGDTLGGITIPGSYFSKYLNENKNADLLDYFNPATSNFTNLYYATSDVDVAIREYLNRAIKLNANYDQIARLNAVFESVLGMMRGGGNDIFTTRLDKEQTGGDTITTATSSDANVTSTRDGVNARYYLAIPNYVGANIISGGSLTLLLSRQTEEYLENGQRYSGGSEAIAMTFPFTMTNNVFNPGEYRTSLYRAFNSLGTNGLYAHNAWTDILAPVFGAGNGLMIPSAEVNYYSPGTYEERYAGTMWDLNGYTGDSSIDGYHVYEIIFVGGAHDSYVSMGFTGTTNSVSRKDIANVNFFGYVDLVTQHMGYEGTPQVTPGLTVLPNGSYVTSWFTNVTTTNGTIIDRKINYRYFEQSQSKVGPRVTDVILPNGEHVANQDMVTYSLEHLVVTFDKELLANGVNGEHSVLNPKNWSIIKDGVKLNNVIKSISFGMNKAKDIIDANPNSSVSDSVLSYGSNKWEVIIEFNTPLGSGNYELVATNKLSDTTGVSVDHQGRVTYGVGNVLGRDGTEINKNGENFSRKFSISAIDGVLSFTGGGDGYKEQLVSDSTGEHNTRTPNTAYDTPGNPTSVASDQQGNFVTAWTVAGGGIMAKIYHQEFVTNNNVRESVITFAREILITDNPNASYASVAMDADGDFVVTWMQDEADGTRNIYFSAFNFNGSARVDADGDLISKVKVNAHIGTHNYPDVAMDTTGGFVITWESLNQVSDTSGYDIYFQRYDSSCTPIGGVDEIQAIQFAGNPSAGGTFQLQYVDERAGILLTTRNIEIGSSLQITAKNIKDALLAIGLEVEVGAASSSVLIQFVGSLGARDVAPLTVKNVKLENPKSGQGVTLSTQTTGASGETRANDTTAGDKRYPSIAIAQGGEVVITWTSWGQGKDSLYETNIYAKNFPSNEAVASRNNQVSLAERIAMMETVTSHQKLVVAADSPDNHETLSDEYTGVVYIYGLNSDGNVYVGSGSLLSSGMHILTAAHVVCESNSGSPLPIENIVVRFETKTGYELYTVSQSIVHPSYTGRYEYEVDLAVLTLSYVAPETAERYEIYRGSDEMSSPHTLVGYGTAGTGTTGNVLPPGTKRSGQNQYEALGTIFDTNYNPNTLVRDFDSGLPANDALGYYFGIYNLGLGAANEVNAAGGDSGGPTFVDGTIAGVVSYGGPMYPNSVTDILPGVNASFGEFSVDVRVSAYSSWIDSIVMTGTTEYLVNQTETGDQIWSDVAVSMSGEVVFTWTSFNQDNAGDGPGGSANGLAGVYARRFTMNGTAVPGAIGVDLDDPDNFDPDTGELILPTGAVMLGNEFLVNNYIVGNQYYSSVSMANNGDFMITWESFQDTHQITVNLADTGHGVGGTTTDTVTDYGVYAKRYTNLETLRTSRANTSVSRYGLPDNTRYVQGYGYVGIHGEIGGEFRVNKDHIAGDQTGATVTLNANGDAIVVFQGNDGGTNSETKVYYRAIPLNADTTAPIVTETVLVVNELQYDADGNVVNKANGDPDTKDGVLMPIGDDSVVYGFPTQMIVTFSEEMYNAYRYDPNSVLNPANWQLLKDGIAMSGAIVSIEFGRDKAFDFTTNKTGKWEAVITFDSDLAENGNQPLKSGKYTLVIKDAASDVDGNKLDGDYNGAAGGNFSRTFRVIVPTLATDPEETDPGTGDGPTSPDDTVFLRTDLGNTKPAVASADDGSYVVVAVHSSYPGTPNEPPLPIYIFDEDTGLPINMSRTLDEIGNIVMQRYDKNGKKVGTEQIVNNYMPGRQTDPDVAMDSFGNFAVVWSGFGPSSNTGVYLRIYDAYGKAVIDQVQINDNNAMICSTPKVAYDDNGNIFVTWIEYNATARTYVVMGRVYDSKGVLQSVSKDGAAGSTSKMMIASNVRDIKNYDIGCDPSGHLIVTWQGHNSTNGTQDIYAKVLKYTSSGAAKGTLTTTKSDFLVNAFTSNIQATPAVAASASGSFVITWASERQLNQPKTEYDIFARRFDMNGNAKTGDMQINTYTLDMQFKPDVSMAANGNYVVTWTSYDQEPDNYDPILGQRAHDNGTFARAFNSADKDLVAEYMPSTLNKEFRLNYATLGNQQNSVVAIHNEGMSFAWVGDVTSVFFLEYDDEGVPIDPVLFNTTEVFTRTYAINSGGNTSSGNSSGSSKSSYSSTQQYGGGGYAGLGKTTYQYDSVDTLFLDGTAGNDVFEIVITASGAFQVKLNGKSVTVGSKVTNIQIDGLGGEDRIVVTTANGNNTAKINTADDRFSLSADGGKLSISALHMNAAELNVGGTNNTMQINASANDVLTLKVNDLLLSGPDYYYAAKGFGTVTASATGSTAKATLFDSAGDDTLIMSAGKAVMKGPGFEHGVSGFGAITAYSTRGNDSATMTGTTGDDVVMASSGTVSMVGSGYKNVAAGFAKTNVIGNGGKDTATIVGSYAADSFIATDSSAQAKFGLGGTVNLTGFTNFNLRGNGGNDTVTLRDAAYSSTSGTTQVYKSKTQTFNVIGFGEVQSYQASAPAVQALQSAVTAFADTSSLAAAEVVVEVSKVASPLVSNDNSLNDDELFMMLAQEHANSTKKQDAGELADELDIDYLLKVGAL